MYCPHVQQLIWHVNLIETVFGLTSSLFAAQLLHQFTRLGLDMPAVVYPATDLCDIVTREIQGSNGKRTAYKNTVTVSLETEQVNRGTPASFVVVIIQPRIGLPQQ